MELELYKCPDCDNLSIANDADIEALYECPDCGTRFTKSNSYTGYNHQCPECHRFSSKVTDNGCTECNEGELEKIEGYQCEECEELFELEDELNIHIAQNHKADSSGAEAHKSS